MRISILNIITLIIPFLLLSGLTADPMAWQAPDSETEVRELVSGLNDDQLLGQVFMIGFTGPGADPMILEWIREKNIGGVKIFGWNGDNLRLLASAAGEMQAIAISSEAGIPLFIATDQEGGWVRHVKGATSITPGNMGIGAGGLPSDAYDTARLIGAELRALGINMNFAPTVDVYINPEAHVIGPRSFSSDPVATAVMSQAFFHGLRSQGVISTAKHFPGHGNADRDSHGTLPIIEDDLATLMERDLLPYRLLIPEGLPAIMTGHLAFPEITGEIVPASLSRRLIHGVLRETLKFKGLVITDDLRMNGAQYSGEGVPEAAEDALRAGNDMIMISLDSQLHLRVWNHLKTVMHDDSSFRQILEEAVIRILHVKSEYLGSEWRVPFVPDPDLISKSIPADKDFLFQQACRALTLVASDTLPVKQTESILLAGQLRGFFLAGEEQFPKADRIDFEYDPFYSAPVDAAGRIASRAMNYDRLIFCLATPGSYLLLEEIVKLQPELRERIAVISVLTPIYLKDAGWIRAAVAAYGMGDESFQAAFAAVAGEFTPRGKLPLEGFK